MTTAYLIPQTMTTDLGVSLLVPQRTAFTFGVRACADARLLFSNLHVRTQLDYRQV